MFQVHRPPLGGLFVCSVCGSDQATPCSGSLSRLPARLETFFQPPALNEGERQGLIRDREGGPAMVQDRNFTRHTYNRSTAEQVGERVRNAAAEEGDG